MSDTTGVDTARAVDAQAADARAAVEAATHASPGPEPTTTPAAGPTLGSNLGTDDHEADRRVMHDDIAAQWELWSMIIGRTAQPRLTAIPQVIPTMTSAMLCTADGLNLCSVGVPRDDVGRLAALNSSLFAVSAAQAEIVEGGGHDAAARDVGATMVSVSTPAGLLVLVGFVQQPLGHLLLAVSARDIELEPMTRAVRRLAADIEGWLATN